MASNQGKLSLRSPFLCLLKCVDGSRGQHMAELVSLTLGPATAKATADIVPRVNAGM